MSPELGCMAVENREGEVHRARFEWSMNTTPCGMCNSGIFKVLLWIINIFLQV